VVTPHLHHAPQAAVDVRNVDVPCAVVVVATRVSGVVEVPVELVPVAQRRAIRLYRPVDREAIQHGLGTPR